MSLNNIFNRKEADRVQVPEIEVHGDQLRVNPEGQQEDPPEQDRGSRNYRLPKTKWW